MSLDSSQPALFFPAIFVFELLIGPLQAGLVISAARSHRSGAAPSAGRMFRDSVEAWPRLFIALILPAILITAGIILLVLPGIYFIVRYTFVGAIAFERDASPVGSARASAAVVRGTLVAAEVVSSLIMTLALAAAWFFYTDVRERSAEAW